MYISKMKRKLLIQFIYIELNKRLYDAESNHKAQHYVIQNVYNVIYFLHPRSHSCPCQQPTIQTPCFYIHYSVLSDGRSLQTKIKNKGGVLKE